MTARAQHPDLTTVSNEKLPLAATTYHPRESVLQNAALQILLQHLTHNRPQRAVLPFALFLIHNLMLFIITASVDSIPPGPLACPNCGTEMKVISFVTERNQFARILAHLKEKGVDARAGPFADSAA